MIEYAATRANAIDCAVRPQGESRDGVGSVRPISGAVTVLIVTTRQSLVSAFERASAIVGLKVVVSPDGLHSLMTAIREPPVLIILDPDVPGIEADTIQRRLASDPRTASVPILRLPSSRLTGGVGQVLPDGHVA